ncbi:hypothetical protein [Achromobacter aloeverae]
MPRNRVIRYFVRRLARNWADLRLINRMCRDYRAAMAADGAVGRTYDRYLNKNSRVGYAMSLCRFEIENPTKAHQIGLLPIIWLAAVLLYLLRLAA